MKQYYLAYCNKIKKRLFAKFIHTFLPFAQNITMAKIRKQPRRSTKKVNQVLIDNPFLDENYYHHLIPNQIYNSLSILKKISITSLDEYVPEFPENSFQINMDSMRQALQDQENRINHLRHQEHMSSHNHFNFSGIHLNTNSNVEQTKKTVNNTQAGMFPDEEGLFNFCDLQDSIMKKRKQHEQIMDQVDWSFLTGRKGENDNISELAVLNEIDNNFQDQQSKFQINMIL